MRPPGPGEGRTPPPAIGRPADFTIPEGRLAQITAAASDFELPLLDDGVLTFAEYEQALFAGFACLEERGARILHERLVVFEGTVHSDFAQARPGPRLTGRWKYSYFPSFQGGVEQDDAQQIVDGCAAEYYSTVELLWTEATSPSEWELESMWRMIGDCMRQGGLDVPQNPSEMDLRVAAFPPDGIYGPQHRAPGGGPVESGLIYLDCRLVTRFDMGFE